VELVVIADGEIDRTHSPRPSGRTSGKRPIAGRRGHFDFDGGGCRGPIDYRP
jgi:hypothetical protein